MGGVESFLNGSPDNNLQEPQGGLETSTAEGIKLEKKEEQQSSMDNNLLEAQDSRHDSTQLQDQTSTKLTAQDGFLGAEAKNNEERLKKTRNRPLHAATRVVSQVASMKTFLKSVKRDSEYVMVELPKRSDDRAADLGFTLHGGIENPRLPGDPGIFIKHVITGSLVDGKLRPGDRVLSINGVNVTKAPLKYARQALTKAEGVVRLYIKKVPRRQQRINEAIKTENEQEIPMFSDEEIEDFEDAFSVFDVNGKGTIKLGDIFPLIRSLGHNRHENDVWCYMNELGLTANRKIKFVEFLRVMAAVIRDENRAEHGLDTIRVFDSEQRGYISSAELEMALKCMPGSKQIKDFELRDILRLADPDGDGRILIPDFRSLVERQ